jgi:hypothetical protein
MNATIKTATDIDTAVAALLAQHKVAMSAVFVPQAMSRNSGEKTHTLNWRVSFTRADVSFALDYQQGIGHVPRYMEPRTLFDQECLGKPWETGKYGHSLNVKRLPAPTAADVLSCVILDSEAIEQSFEDWASDFGYDTDSRKAERIYHECVAQARDAQRVLGASLIAQLRELFADY